MKGQHITAPTINWRFSGLLRIYAVRKFSDIFEKKYQKSPTAGSCKPLCMFVKLASSIAFEHGN